MIPNYNIFLALPLYNGPRYATFPSDFIAVFAWIGRLNQRILTVHVCNPLDMTLLPRFNPLRMLNNEIYCVNSAVKRHATVNAIS